MTRFFSQVILERNGSGGADTGPRRLTSPSTLLACATSSPVRPGSSARTSPRRSQAAGHEVDRDRLLHRLLRPGAEGGERPRARRPDGSTSPRTSSTSTGFDGVFHLAGQPGVRASATSSPLPAPQRARLAARVRGGGPRRRRVVVFASSSSVYGAAERYPTPEDTTPQPLSPYGITKLACEHLAAAYAREFGLDCVVLRYFNAFGPRQRPDMAFTRIVERARRRQRRSSSTATATSRAAGRTSATSSPRRSWRRWSAAPAPTTSAAATRRRSTRRSRCSSGSRAARSR